MQPCIYKSFSSTKLSSLKEKRLSSYPLHIYTKCDSNVHVVKLLIYILYDYGAYTQMNVYIRITLKAFMKQMLRNHT